MYVIIQIPCFNEEQTLPAVLESLPKSLPGVNRLEVLIINDGSKDKTADVARELGVQHVVSFPCNRGLASAFSAGIEKGLSLGADIIVNTDADHQYPSHYIPQLIQPILDKQADIVIADRQTETIKHFSPLKRFLQKLGSKVVSFACGSPVPDAPSGFRAYSREAASRLHVYNRYTYTIETLVQASHQGLHIHWIPIEVNPTDRPSRLVRSMPAYIFKAVQVLIRTWATYKPIAFFTTLAALCFIPSMAICLRFLYFFIQGNGNGHIQSLILSSILLSASFALLLAGIISDQISRNRFLLESIRIQLNRKAAEKREDS